MRRGGYTLVEVLAVSVLLGLLAALGVPPLMRAITGDPLARAAQQLAQTFRDARAQAFGHRLSLDLEPWGFTAAIADDGARTALPSVHLPDSVYVSWTRTSTSVRQLLLDARGHGLDTDVYLHQGGQDLVFTIDGLTGRWTPKVQP
jgi:prepilin-type N-terminal cleavage/methylation domain-containing protein